MKEEIQKELEVYFKGLNLDGWQLTGGKFKKGGQAVLLEVKNEQKGRGIFRKLNRQKDQDIQRFIREVTILQEPQYKSPFIVELLEYSVVPPNLWYISKLGEPFDTYWDKILNELADDPDKIIEKAIAIIKDLSTGLIPLHKARIVHRDIKIANTILTGTTPQLIDFGIAFIEGEERLTPLNEAAANRISHDLQIRPGLDVPPWLDVYLLSQMLISMVSEKPIKNWHRPLDWRWVLYPEKLSRINVEKLRALTALCSNPYTSPQDATELISLIDTLFSSKPVNNSTTMNYDKIRELIDSGKAVNIQEYSNIKEKYESTYPVLLDFIKRFSGHVIKVSEPIKNNKLPIELIIPDEEGLLKDYNNSLREKEDTFGSSIQTPSIQVKCTDKNKGFYISVAFFFRTHKNDPWYSKWLVSMGLSDVQTFEGPLQANSLQKQFMGVWQPNGTFEEYDGNSKATGAIFTQEDVFHFFEKWINDQMVWEVAFQ